jgi:hypothetical protein
MKASKRSSIMTDEEIRSLMYEYADCFTNTVHFTDQGVLDFARAILNSVSSHQENKQKEERPQYEDALWNFVERADQFMDT